MLRHNEKAGSYGPVAQYTIIPHRPGSLTIHRRHRGADDEVSYLSRYEGTGKTRGYD
jgi:hypothetical protein